MLGVAIQRFVLAHARHQRAIVADAASLTKGYHAFEADFGIRCTTEMRWSQPTCLLA